MKNDSTYARETKLLYHEIVVPTELLRREENDAFNRLIKIINTALLISNRVKLRAHYDGFGHLQRKLRSWHYEYRNEISLWFNDENEIEPKSKVIWLIDSPDKHYDAPNYVLFKFGSNEKKFEEKVNLDSWVPNKRSSPEHMKSKKLITARLNQCHTVLHHSDHDSVKIARDLIHDCQSIVEELGVYPLVEYGSRTLKVLAELDGDEPLINCAITAMRTCCIISNDTLAKVNNHETLISDRLWATLYLIQDELANSTTKPGRPSDKQLNKEEKPSFWDEFITEKQANVVPVTKDFKKWLIQLKSRASVIALNRFIDTIVDSEDAFTSFAELFAALKPSDQVDSRIFPVLPPPRYNTVSVETWPVEKSNKRMEKSIRKNIKFGAEFAKISGGAIMLICRDVPREFNFFGDCEIPLAEFGVRLS